MTDLTTFFGPNAGYVLDLYDRYLADPSVGRPGNPSLLRELHPDQPERRKRNGGRAATGADRSAAPTVATVAARRRRGRVDPSLARVRPPGGATRPARRPPARRAGARSARGTASPRTTCAALPASAVRSPVADGAANAAEAIARLRAIYCGAIGYDFDHVQIAEERAWLRDAVENGRFSRPLDAGAKRELLARLTEVEGFEKFLHQTYLGQKRFSIEGTDILVPMLDESSTTPPPTAPARSSSGWPTAAASTC